MIIRFAGVLSSIGLAIGLAAAPGVAQTPAPAMAAPDMTNGKSRLTVRYNCENLKVPVIYEKKRDRVVITYAAKYWTLPRVKSADGVRYVGHGLEWWVKGPKATLSSVDSSMQADKVLASCTAPVKK